MGALHDLGKGEFDLSFIKKSLDPTSDIEFVKILHQLLVYI